MKRHPCLQPLSREHHLGLMLAKNAKNCKDSNDITKHWQALNHYLDEQMQQHFVIEEMLMAQFVAQSGNAVAISQITKMQKDHQVMATGRDNPHPTLADLHALADTLTDHIRFEERQVYPILESLLEESQLLSIFNACHLPVK